MSSQARADPLFGIGLALWPLVPFSLNTWGCSESRRESSEHFERSSRGKAGQGHCLEVLAARRPWSPAGSSCHRRMYKGDALPTLFTTDEISARALCRACRVIALIPFCSKRHLKQSSGFLQLWKWRAVCSNTACSSLNKNSRQQQQKKLGDLIL